MVHHPLRWVFGVPVHSDRIIVGRRRRYNQWNRTNKWNYGPSRGLSMAKRIAGKKLHSTFGVVFLFCVVCCTLSCYCLLSGTKSPSSIVGFLPGARTACFFLSQHVSVWMLDGGWGVWSNICNMSNRYRGRVVWDASFSSLTKRQQMKFKSNTAIVPITDGRNRHFLQPDLNLAKMFVDR